MQATRRYYSDLRASLTDRIRARIIVAPDTGCWEWQGSLRTGYGQINYHGKRLSTHRVMYADAKGEIPKGLHLDHLCRNRRCCNPEHLEAVTHRENNLRGVAPAILLHRQNQCASGHDLTNAYVRASGGRMCRECGARRQREYAAKRRAL